MNPGAQSHPVRHGWRAFEHPAEVGQLASGIDLFSLAHPAQQIATNCAQPTKLQQREWGTRITSVWVEVLRVRAGKRFFKEMVTDGQSKDWCNSVGLILKPTGFNFFFGFFDMKSQVKAPSPGLALDNITLENGSRVPSSAPLPSSSLSKSSFFGILPFCNWER